MCACVKDTVVFSKTKMEIKINKNSNIEKKFVIYLICLRPILSTIPDVLQTT